MVKTMSKFFNATYILALLIFSFAQISNAQISQPVGPGGRPLTFAAHGVLIGHGATNATSLVDATGNLCLVSQASSDPVWLSCSTGAGTVTNFSIANANGFTGSVGNATTTPALTVNLSTGNGVLKANTGAIQVATGGVDYSIGTSALATGILKSTTTTGALTIAASGSDYAPATTGSSILYGNGAGGFSNATVGTGLAFTGGTLTGTSVINGYINGFTLSNDVTTPNSVLDIAVGWAADSTNTVTINGNSAFTKNTAGSWSAGTGNKGMGVGLTVANNTFYHVFAIINGGIYDVYFDTSITAANKPASTTAFRYIGSFRTNGSAQITGFFQIGQRFLWATPTTDLSSGTSTTAALFTLNVPPNIAVYPMLIIAGISGTRCASWSPILGSSYPASGYGTTVTSGAMNIPQIDQITDTSRQLYYSVSGTLPACSIITNGYINPKVAPNN